MQIGGVLFVYSAIRDEIVEYGWQGVCPAQLLLEWHAATGSTGRLCNNSVYLAQTIIILTLPTIPYDTLGCKRGFVKEMFHGNKICLGKGQ